jgi:hypothetical protein
VLESHGGRYYFKADSVGMMCHGESLVLECRLNIPSLQQQQTKQYSTVHICLHRRVLEAQGHILGLRLVKVRNFSNGSVLESFLLFKHGYAPTWILLWNLLLAHVQYVF